MLNVQSQEIKWEYNCVLTHTEWPNKVDSNAGIKRKLYESEVENAEIGAVMTGKSKLQRVLAAYGPEDVLNLDKKVLL